MKSGDEYFTYEITGLVHNAVGSNVDEVYFVEVTAVSGTIESAPAYAMAYVSDGPPPQNRITTIENNDDTRETVRFASVATFPVNARWNPTANDAPPVYEYVICNQIATSNQSENNGNDTTLPMISDSRKQDIVDGIQSWQKATHRDGFWKGRRDDLFVIRLRAGNTGCGAISNNTHQSNNALNEVMVVNMYQRTMICGTGNIACAISYPSAKKEVTTVQTADIYILQDLESSVRCSRTLETAAHEAGHALAFYGGGDRHGHSFVKSVMHIRETYSSGFCGPSFSDIGALAAVYQSRSTFTSSNGGD